MCGDHVCQFRQGACIETLAVGEANRPDSELSQIAVAAHVNMHRLAWVALVAEKEESEWTGSKDDRHARR
jgi:hypothetical protein